MHVWRTICVLCIALGGIAQAQTHMPRVDTPWDNQYPTTVIGNERLAARIMLPDLERGFYRAVRFDHFGIVSRVVADGHSYYGVYISPDRHDPTHHDHIAGICEEFDIDGPAGYDEAAPGQRFVKIGVGVLQRDGNADYFFARPYQLIDPGKRAVEHTDRSVTFRQTVDGPRGWAYDYTKLVRVDKREPKLIIERTLRNTGTKTIDTLHYSHNFTTIDDQPADANYVIAFPFEARSVEHRDRHGLVRIVDGRVTFTRRLPRKQSSWYRLVGYDPDDPNDNAATVINRATGASVRVSNDRPLARLAMYAHTPVVCPEPFVRLRIDPGEQATWSTTYTFSADDE